MKPTSRRASSRLLLGLALGCSLFSGDFTKAASATSPQRTGGAGSARSCKAVSSTPVKVRYRDGRGLDYATEAPGRTKVADFDEGGDKWTTFTPPSGFRPTAATDTELAAAGFAPRPAAGPQLDDWNAAYANYKGVAPAKRPEDCDNLDGLALNNTSSIWSGPYTGAYSDYRRVAGVMRWPSFNTTSCPSSALFGMWAGIGGQFSKALLQTGVVIPPLNASNTGIPFWEGFTGSGHDGGAREFASSLSFTAQDTARPDVYFSSADGTVSFVVLRQDGYSTEIVKTATIDNYSVAQSYYSGTSGEFIHERPLYMGSPTYLRDFGSVGVSSAQVTRAGMAADFVGNFPHNLFDMTSNGFASGTLLASVVQGLATSGSWTDVHYNCS